MLFFQEKFTVQILWECFLLTVPKSFRSCQQPQKSSFQYHSKQKHMHRLSIFKLQPKLLKKRLKHKRLLKIR